MNITELRDNNSFTSKQIIRFFDQWASTDLRNEFIEHAESMFDLPACVYSSVEDFKECMRIDWEQIFVELSQFLSSDQQNEFSEDICRDYDIALDVDDDENPYDPESYEDDYDPLNYVEDYEGDCED